MATIRKKGVNKTKKKPTPVAKKTKSLAVKQNLVKTKKARVRKIVNEKKTSQKTTSPVRKSSSFVSWRFIVISTMVVILTLASLFAIKPYLLSRVDINLLMGQITTNQDLLSFEPDGYLLTRDQDPNAEKLKEIFQTVFSNTKIKEINYLSDEGQKWIHDLGLTEIPSLFFEADSFNQESLAPVVKDVFELKEQYYLLNVELVNPSNQLQINGPPSGDSAVVFGSHQAPLGVYLYSDPACQQCRAFEQNNSAYLQELIAAQTAQVYFLDLPQSSTQGLHVNALRCLNQINPDKYLAFRETLFNRVNLTTSFTKHSFNQFTGLDYDQACLDQGAQFTAPRDQTDLFSVTGVPTILIGKNGGSEFLRFTGSSFDQKYFEGVVNDILPPSF